MVNWTGLKPVEPGVLFPCGTSPDGSHREFFVHPSEVPALLADGIKIRLDGVQRTFTVGLSSTPYYANGDVQVVAKRTW